MAERRLDTHTHYGTRVIAAYWHSAEALWHVTVATSTGIRVQTARFLYLASGY